jgi:hypothetical protein
MYPNPFESQDFAEFWQRIEQEWAERVKYNFYYDSADPDYYTCPYCGLVGSCMCEEIAEEELDPEGLGIEEDYPYW